MTARNTASDGSRTYTVPDGDGGTVDLPSVTTITGILDKSGPIKWWAAGLVANHALDNLDYYKKQLEKSDREKVWKELRKSFTKKTEAAMSRGTDVHSIIEDLILGKTVDIDPASLPYVNAFRRFVEDHPSSEFEATELVVFNLTHGYAGTCDALMRSGGRVGALDWKSRQAKKVKDVYVYEGERLQVAAYANAEFFVAPDGSVKPFPKVDGGSVVMLCEDGYSVGKVDVEADFKGFLAAASLFRWKESL